VDETSQTAIELAMAEERIRQERETFDHNKLKDARWFPLRLAMGYASIVLLITITTTCVWMIFHYKNFSLASVTAATSALFVEVVGLMIWIVKTVLGKGPEGLEPVSGEVSFGRPRTPAKSVTSSTKVNSKS
jgi:hypothetical protein